MANRITIELDGFDEVIAAAEDLGLTGADGLLKYCLFDGAAALNEAIERKVPKSLVGEFTPAKMQKAADGWQTVITFEDFNIPPNEEPNVKILNILEYGEHSPARHETPIAPRHWLSKAVSESKKTVDEAVENAQQEYLRKHYPSLFH